MKKLLLIIAVFSVLLSCNSDSSSSGHEAQWSPDGKDSVVYVRYQNDNGSFSNFYMNYLLFNTLFNRGGYSECYHYYNSIERQQL